MRCHLRRLSLAGMLAVAPTAQAADEASRDRFGPWVPDFAELQSGGFAGTLALGVGYAPLHGVLNVAVLYGYVPPAFGGSVHSLHATLQVHPLSFSSHGVRWQPAYVGVGALCTWGPGYFLLLPERYPAGYYPPNACHATLQLGAELKWEPRAGLVRAHGVYFELTTVDTLMFDYFQNPRVTHPAEVVSSAIGYRLSL